MKRQKLPPTCTSVQFVNFLKRVNRRGMSIVAACAFLTFIACDDWGKMDPPSGNQIYPTLKQVCAYALDSEIDSVFAIVLGSEGDVPTIEDDEELGSVLHLNGGSLNVSNQINHAESGISVTFWAKQPVVDKQSTLFAFGDLQMTDVVKFNAGGQVVSIGSSEYTSPEPAAVDTILTDDKWTFLAVLIESTGYKVYVDGGLSYSVAADLSSLVTKIVAAPLFILGGSSADTYIDNVKIYRNSITEKEYKRPSVSGGGGEDQINYWPLPIYFNNFDKGVNDAVIYGGGSIVDKGDVWGGVFSNVGGSQRSNYLLLPEDVLSHSVETKATTIGVWVNKGNETDASAYQWSPLFTAYAAQAAENSFPMMACQYRGVLQVNCAGWSDYTDDQNVAGANTLYHGDTDWLVDGNWHYYTATFTATTAKVYFDGELKNSWVLDGATNTAAGLFSNGADLKYICLGGNQAWNWGDPDAGFWFDDVAIWNTELSADEIKGIMIQKQAVYFNNFEIGAGDATVYGNGTFIDSNNESFGKVFSNVGGSQRSNYLLLPEDVLSHSVETKATTIGVWVNKGNETDASAYQWSPLFTAYAAQAAENSFPMMACQYRGVLQVNCAGWSDYTDDQNVAGANTLYHGDTDWLVDGNWHYYTATFTATTAKVYFDGELKNSWVLDGATNTAAGLFSNGADLKYICLGGNQAWSWGDPDAGFWFDDVAIWNRELSQDEIKILVNAK